MSEKGAISLTDEELLGLIKSHDPNAIKCLFEKYYSPLCKFLSIYLKDDALTEELIADLFLKLWNNRENYKMSIVKSYLFIEARNMALNQIQKRSSPLHFVDSLENYQEVLQHDNTPFNLIRQKEKYDEILALINKLPTRQREILLMSRIEGMEKEKIAEILGISVRTVETTLYTAIKEVRILISNKQRAEE